MSDQWCGYMRFAHVFTMCDTCSKIAKRARSNVATRIMSSVLSITHTRALGALQATLRLRQFRMARRTTRAPL